MKAIVRETYGPPEVLHLEEVPLPNVGDGDVLVRVQAASANAGDWHLLRGTPLPFRLVAGLRKPRFKIIGNDIAGRVEAAGRTVTQFRPGDHVFGELSRCRAEPQLADVHSDASHEVHEPSPSTVSAELGTWSSGSWKIGCATQGAPSHTVNGAGGSTCSHAQTPISKMQAEHFRKVHLSPPPTTLTC